MRALLTYCLVVLVLIGVVFIIEQSSAEEGEKEHRGCFEYQDQTYCEVWVKADQEWALCYRTVPTSVPLESIPCHE